MNTSAYIDSGILEEYVLGVVSAQEKQEVDCLSHVYPEVQDELFRLEETLERYALLHQVPVRSGLKNEIFSQMNFGPVVAAASDDDHAVRPLTSEREPEDTPTRPLWGLIAVAASVLLAIFGTWMAYQYSAARGENEKLAAQVNTLDERTNTLQQKVEYNEALAANYRDPNVKIVRMPGLEKAPDSEVVALWNQQTNEVLLDVQNLPTPPTGKQYQLWTIVNGKPVDMGMIDPNFAGKLLRMKASDPNAAAFAITLEKTGGVPSPTMEEMYVMGKV